MRCKHDVHDISDCFICTPTQPPEWTQARDAAADSYIKSITQGYYIAGHYIHDSSTDEMKERAKNLFNAGWSAGRTFELERAKDLANALEGLMKLIDDGVLVRNTDDDHDIMKFMEQGVRLTTHLQACQTALAAYGG